ncbi:type II toxin-antitoxin system PrlF family antitoxin [bacterium]|nr:type II toxin-antitoxin system PrlF family antitoxin [bacterium]
MAISHLSSKGQTTIPKAIREHLNLHTGDKIEFVVDENGRVRLEAINTDIFELEGILHKQGINAVSIEEMNHSIKRQFHT